MGQLQKLVDRIIDRANVNLREPAFDVGAYVRKIIPLEQFSRFYAFYGLGLHHPTQFHFSHSSLAGSYFLGRCVVDHAVLYKTDVRGDELKLKGDVFKSGNLEIPLHDDEIIRISWAPAGSNAAKRERMFCGEKIAYCVVSSKPCLASHTNRIEDIVQHQSCRAL